MQKISILLKYSRLVIWNDFGHVWSHLAGFLLLKGAPSSCKDRKWVPPLVKNLVIPLLEMLPPINSPSPPNFCNPHYNNFRVIIQQNLHVSCIHCSCNIFILTSLVHTGHAVHTGHVHSHQPIKKSSYPHILTVLGKPCLLEIIEKNCNHKKLISQLNSPLRWSWLNAWHLFGHLQTYRTKLS